MQFKKKDSFDFPVQCVGDKGTSGAKGQKGELGDAGADWYNAPAKNWRQCTWNAADGRDSGQINYAVSYRHLYQMKVRGR